MNQLENKPVLENKLNSKPTNWSEHPSGMNFGINKWKRNYTLKLLISGQDTELGKALWCHHPWSTTKYYSRRCDFFYRKAGMPNTTHSRSPLKGGNPDFKCFQLSSVPATAFPAFQISVFVTRNLDESRHQSNLLKIKWEDYVSSE